VEAGAVVNELPPARGPGLMSLGYIARLWALNLAEHLLKQGAALNSSVFSGPFTQNPAGFHWARPRDCATCDGRLDMSRAIDAANVQTSHSPVARVLQAWAARHSTSLLEAEAAWQRTKPYAFSELPEVWSEVNVSESGDSISSGD